MEWKSWVQGWARGLGLESSNVSQLWIGVQFSFFEANSGMDSRMLVVGTCTEYIIVVVITLWGQHTQWHVCIHHWDFREVLICGVSVWFQLSCSPGTTVPPWSFVSARLYTVTVVAGLEVSASLIA